MKLILATILAGSLAGSFLMSGPVRADESAPAAKTKNKKSKKADKADKADKKSDDKAATPPSGGGW